MNNLEFCESPKDIENALKDWEKEFKAADIPSNREYQFSCPGRHTETRVLTGDGLVPILNKILKQYVVKRYDREGNLRESTMTNVIRVETGNNVNLSDDVVLVDNAGAEKESQSTKELHAENLDPADDNMEVTGEENKDDILAVKSGGLITRGIVRKYIDDGHYDEQTPSGTFLVKLTNGQRMAMSANEVYDGK